MADAYAHIYKGLPTSGGTDGTLVSEGTGLTPVSIGPLNIVTNEVSDPVKLAIRCVTGYKTVGDVTITPTGTTAAKWALAPDSSGSPGTFGAYGAALTISSEIGATNTIFWAKAKATNDESEANDVTVTLAVAGYVVTTS